MKKVDRIVGAALHAVDYIAMILLATTVLVLIGNVILRAVFNAPIFWTLDYVRLIMLCVVSLTLAGNENQGGNITITFLTEKMLPKVENIIGIFTYVLNVALCAVCTKLIFDIGITSLRNGDKSDTLNWPIYIFYYILSLGFALLTILLVIKIIRRFTNHKSLPREALSLEDSDDYPPSTIL